MDGAAKVAAHRRRMLDAGKREVRAWLSPAEQDKLARLREAWGIGPRFGDGEVLAEALRRIEL